jgi:exopolysaccharide production protein ExoY
MAISLSHASSASASSIATSRRPEGDHLGASINSNSPKLLGPPLVPNPWGEPPKSRGPLSKFLRITFSDFGPLRGTAGFDAPDPHSLPPVGGRLKRSLDIVVALLALIAILPLMIVIALLIRRTGGGPAIYAHERVGYSGRTFPCYKFRTMVRDADATLASHLASNPEAAIEWRETQKLRNDPRVTPVGRLLRKSSLDELPQLINILRGDMSCVGPRPVTVGELERYGEYVRDYLSARPGLTGRWQVTGRSSADFPTRVSLDKQYVRNWSLLSDLAILAKTPLAVVRVQEAF